MDGNAYVLKQFGRAKKSARKEYRGFVAEGLGMGKVPELSCGGLIRSKGRLAEVLSSRRLGQKEEPDERILGSGEFVSAILKEAEETTICQMKLRRSGLIIKAIIDEEYKRGKISLTELINGGRRRKVSAIRAKIAKRGLAELGLSLAEIARNVGINTSGVAKAIDRMADAE